MRSQQPARGRPTSAGVQPRRNDSLGEENSFEQTVSHGRLRRGPATWSRPTPLFELQTPPS